MSDIKDITTTTGGDESLLVAQAENGDAEKIVTFDDLGLSKDVLKAVHDLGFESPTPVQERSIPVVLEKSVRNSRTAFPADFTPSAIPSNSAFRLYENKYKSSTKGISPLWRK